MVIAIVGLWLKISGKNRRVQLVSQILSLEGRTNYHFRTLQLSVTTALNERSFHYSGLPRQIHTHKQFQSQLMVEL